MNKELSTNIIAYFNKAGMWNYDFDRKELVLSHYGVAPDGGKLSRIQYCNNREELIAKGVPEEKIVELTLDEIVHDDCYVSDGYYIIITDIGAGHPS